ncbi:MAG: inositol [Methylocystaceae bacterium]|nr:MAG: inositol [Methylocystaceae bacterium]
MMGSSQAELAAFLPKLESVTRRAGDIAMAYFRLGEATTAAVSYKGGGSPVTEADFAVDRFLFHEMARIAPEAAWLSEESVDTAERLGTLAFSRGDARWSVSIALVVGGRPVAGIIHAPALGETYVGALGLGAFLNGSPLIAPQRAEIAGAALVAPRTMQDRLAASPRGFVMAPRTPSLALRLADIAAGRHDIVVAGPNARDWDIAAADILLAEAGAMLSEPEGVALTYNRASLARDMLIAAPKSLFDDSLALAREVLEGKL